MAEKKKTDKIQKMFESRIGITFFNDDGSRGSHIVYEPNTMYEFTAKEAQFVLSRIGSSKFKAWKKAK